MKPKGWKANIQSRQYFEMKAAGKAMNIKLAQQGGVYSNSAMADEYEIVRMFREGICDEEKPRLQAVVSFSPKS